MDLFATIRGYDDAGKPVLIEFPVAFFSPPELDEGWKLGTPLMMHVAVSGLVSADDLESRPES